MSFHRLTVPSYFGGLPGGYDYINNAISGTPANANGPLVAGPNTGSYFVGFGDDATSANANRPNLALAQNTDFLDNLFHQDLAAPTSSAVLTSAGDTSYVAVGSIYVGKPGTPNTPAGILSFAKVLDINGNEIEVAGVAVVVNSITGATVGTTFSSTNVTFNFNIAVPTGVQYRVWYATRSNLANLPVDAFTNVTIRTTQELPAAFEDFIAQVAVFSGLNVFSLVATNFSTPDGTRLAKQSHMNFWVDPDGSNGGTHEWFWTVSPAGANKIMLHLTENVLVPDGTGGSLIRAANIAEYFQSAWLVSDPNSQTYAPAAPYNAAIHMTSASPFGGSVMKWDRTVTASDVSTYAVDIATIPHINSRWTATCGDATLSFGDFNGPTAIFKALGYAAAHGITSGRIQVKAGTYTVDGSSQIALPAGSSFTIEGVSASPNGVNILSAAGAPTALIKIGTGVSGGAFLELKNLRVVYSAGSSTQAVDFTGSTLWMENVQLSGLVLFAEKPKRMNQSRNCFQARHCYIDPTVTTGVPTMTLQVDTPTGAGDEISGVLFEDCYLASQFNQPILMAKANVALTGVGSISGVKFNRCEINLGYASGTSQHIAGPAGVLAVDPNGMSNGTPVNGIYPNIMYVRDVEWSNCFVRAVNNTGSGSNILMHLVPFTNGQTTPTVVAAIGSIIIRGGRWEIGDASFENFSPFFCAARNVVIEDVAFRGNIVGGNGSPTVDMQNALLGNGTRTTWTDSSSTTTPYAQNWGAFTIAPGANQVYDVNYVYGDSDTPPSSGVGPTAPGLTIKNMSISNLPRDGGCGDLLLNVARHNNNVSGIRLHGYADTNLGFSLPTFRVWIFASGPSTGVISGISATGANAVAGHPWLTNVGQAGEYVGIFRLTAGGKLHVKDCSANLFLVNGAADTSAYGFNMAIPADVGTPYNPAGLTLDHCYADFCSFGFLCSSASSTHPQVTFRLNHCIFQSHSTDGALVNFTHTGISNEAVFEQCQINSNTRYGLNILGSFAFIDLLSITGNTIKGNGGSYQVQYIPTAEPGGIFMNNDMGFSGNTRAKPGGVAITSGTPMLGFETGTGANSGARAYANGSSMLFNNGAVLTV